MYETSMYPNGIPSQDPTPISPSVRKCLVDGCSCKDARMLSRRTMMFVRAIRPDAQPFRDPATLTSFSVTG